MEDADLVAQDLDDEGAAVVGEGGLAGERADGNLVDELTDAIGGDLEADGDADTVGAKVTRVVATTAPSRRRSTSAEAPARPSATRSAANSVNVLDEGELTGVELGDGNVAQGRGAGADGGDRDAEGARGQQERVLGRLSLWTCPREQAVGEDQDGGEGAGVVVRAQGGGLGQLGEGGGEVGGGAVDREREGAGVGLGDGAGAIGEAAQGDGEALLAPGRAGLGPGGPERAQAVDAGGRGRTVAVGVGEGHAGGAVSTAPGGPKPEPGARSPWRG